MFKVRKTNVLTAVLTGLRKYTNYSIQVVAFTRVGDGVPTRVTYCHTEEDGTIDYLSICLSIYMTHFVRARTIKKAGGRRACASPRGFGRQLIDLLCRTVPGSPADIKVVVSSPQALFISWLPPLEPNGVITKYNLYTRFVPLFCHFALARSSFVAFSPASPAPPPTSFRPG